MGSGSGLELILNPLKSLDPKVRVRVRVQINQTWLDSDLDIINVR